MNVSLSVSIYVFVCQLVWQTENCSRNTEELDKEEPRGTATKAEPQGKHSTNSWKKRLQLWVQETQAQRGTPASASARYENATHTPLPGHTHQGGLTGGEPRPIRKQFLRVKLYLVDLAFGQVFSVPANKGLCIYRCVKKKKK